MASFIRVETEVKSGVAVCEFWEERGALEWAVEIGEDTGEETGSSALLRHGNSQSDARTRVAATTGFPGVGMRGFGSSLLAR
jgi:hypothetical protein